MQTQKSSTDTYVLGQAPEAIQRLLKQGQLLNPFTRRVLEEAGSSEAPSFTLLIIGGTGGRGEVCKMPERKIWLLSYIIESLSKKEKRGL